MKKKVFVLAVIVVMAAILATGTLAYFTDKVVAHNVITSGAVDIDLVETMKTPEGETPWEDQDGVMPGTEVSKIVRVRNNDAESYIRVKVDVKVVSAEGTALDPSVVGITMNTSHWTEKDGYWHYNKSLPTGQTTEMLFEQVNFAGAEMGNEYQNATITVNVDAQAVQAENNGSTVWEAKGWPKD